MGKSLVAALAAFSVIGCGGGTYEDTLRAKAANDFSCPAPQVTFNQVSSNGQIRQYDAQGCGKTKSYDVNCGLLTCTAWQHEDAPQGGGMAVAPPPNQGSGSEPAAPQTVSITMHNTCKETVKMFEGKDPKFSSGTQTNMSSNEIRNFTLGVGDMLWIIDDSGNGISNLTASPGTTRMKILESCSGFAAD
jgi:hypothetical protein